VLVNPLLIQTHVRGQGNIGGNQGHAELSFRGVVQLSVVELPVLIPGCLFSLVLHIEDGVVF